MDNLYDMILEDGRIEWYKVETEVDRDDGTIVHNTYNFIDIKNLVSFINKFLKSNNAFVSKDSILEELETTDSYSLLGKEFKINCSLHLINFEG